MKKLIIQILLALVIVFLAYKCYESIMVPERFKKEKTARYERIINRLKDIRASQDAFKETYGRYTSSLDTLIHFVKYDSVKTIRSIGSLTDEQLEQGMTEAEAIKKGFIIREEAKIAALTYIKDKRIRELVDAADSSKVFNYAIEDMKYVPFTNRKHEFKMGAGSVRTDSGLEIPVFEARVSNTVIFENLDEVYHESILEENGERLRLKKYPGLKVGDLEEANNNVGNWE